MEEQIPASQIPESPVEQQQIPQAIPQPIPGQITREMLEQMKMRAREMAVQMAVGASQAPVPVQQPQIVYVRRNLTVAELILVFALSCGVVLGIQGIAGVVMNHLPRIEVKVK